MEPTHHIRYIVSGGQTGADRGGLDAAINLGLPHGGWCPMGRRAEDGRIPVHYQLKENRSPKYIVRTRQNIVDSDATVIFTFGRPMGGSLSTLILAKQNKRPHLHVDLSSGNDQSLAANLAIWITHLHKSATPHLPGFDTDPDGLILNIAGSRESQAPGIHIRVQNIIELALARTP